MKTDKIKYAVALILLLSAFVCGLNFKQWHHTGRRVEKHITLVYPFTSEDGGYGNFEEHLHEEFRQRGIEPVFHRIYLDCNNLNTAGEIASIKSHLDLLANKKADLILAIGDQPTYAMLSTRHALLSSVPVVACNVHFPDEKLIEEYSGRPVYVLRDTPDFRSNIEFIKTLYCCKDIEVIYNVDFTFLGQRSFEKLTHVIDRKNVQVIGFEAAFIEQKQYLKLQDMIAYYNLKPAVGNHRFKKEELTISLCPFRYIKGTPLLIMMEKTKADQSKQAFLLDKFDLIALPTAKALNIPSFSCVREGFGEDAKIVGGYMATEEISARSAADVAAHLMMNREAGVPQISDLEKEYVLDWTYFSAYDNFDTHNVPGNVRIINFPFQDRYRKELYCLLGLFILAFILISVSLLRMRRRSRVERKNMEMLQEAHKRLTLSTDGGRISLWNIQDDNIEFDSNFTRMVGLEQRRFARMDFQRYAHPDEVHLLDALYEALHHSHDMLMQRVRFCFGPPEDGYRWFELRCRSLKDTKGRLMMAGIFMDIQEQVDREDQLILAKQIAENAELKQSFLNNMSHEIRTPLNAIVGFTNLLLSEEADGIEPEEKEMMLDIVNRNNTLLLQLINDVVEIACLDSGDANFDIKEYDLADVLKEVYTAFKSLIKPSLNFQLELDDTAPLPVYIDRMRLIQVLSNFLNNANKFTSGGSVTLGCSADHEQHSVCIYIKDTGKGIEEKELMMIFDRFYKSDEFEQGSGLGLSICKIIIERLHGQIEVESEVGRGSCFKIILDLVAGG